MPELSKATLKALSKSDYFVLLASPRAATSPSVGRELDWWLEHRDPERILIVLADGEISWSTDGSDFDWSLTNSLPASLSGRFRNEPLYDDLRWVKDPAELTLELPDFSRSIASIAAAIRGIAKDELIGRDVRQHKRLVATTRGVVSILIVLVLLISAAGIYAVQKRDEARRLVAESLLSNADSAASGGRLFESQNLATDAKRIYEQLDRDTFEPNLALMETYIAAPPSMVNAGIGDGWMTFAPDREHGLYVDGRSAELIDLKTLRTLGPYVEIDRDIESVWLAPADQTLLVEDEDHRLTLWRRGAETPIRVLDGHDAQLRFAALSADGNFAVTAADDSTTVIWDLLTGEAMHDIAPGEKVQSIAITADSQLVVTASFDAGVTVWRARSGDKIRRLERPGGFVTSVAVSDDGQFALTGGEALILWNLRNGEVIRRFWDAPTPVTDVAISSDGSRVMASFGVDQPLTRVWFRQSGAPEFTFKGSSPSLAESNWSPHGVGIIHIDGDRQHFSLRISDRSLVRIAAHSIPIYTLEFSPSGELLATIDSDGQHMLWDVATGYPLGALSIEGEPISGLRFLEDGRQIAFATTSHWGIVDLETRATVKRVEADMGGAPFFAMSKDGSRLIAGGADQTVQLWDIASEQVVASAALPGDLQAVAFADNDDVALIGGNQFLLSWNPGTGEVGYFGDEEDVTGWQLAVSANDRMCTMGQGLLSILLWDAVSRRQLAEFYGPSHLITQCHVSTDGSWLAASSWDGQVHFWDIDSRRRLPAAAIRARISSVRFSPDGDHLAVGMADGGLQLWRLSRADDYDRFRPAVMHAVDTLASEPDHLESLALLAEWYAFREIWTWALDLFEEVMEAGGDVSYLWLARTYWTLDRFDEATMAFEQALIRGEASTTYVRLCQYAIELERTTTDPATEQ